MNETIDQKSKRLSTECGDSLNTLLTVLRRELCELEFKGIHFKNISIVFIISGNQAPVLEVKIWSSAISKTYSSSDHDDSRFWVYNGSRDNKKIFWLLEMWKMDLVKNHQQLLKNKTLFDS